MQESLDYVERALARLEEGAGAETEAHNIRAYLINTLELIDRDPGIEAAADDLYATAAAFAVGHGPDGDHGPERRDRRVLREAFLRLQDKLAGARPSDRLLAWGWNDRDKPASRGIIESKALTWPAAIVLSEGT